MESLSELMYYFEDEMQLTNIFIHEDEEGEILHANEVIISYDWEKCCVSFNINIFPDFAALASIDLYKTFGSNLIIGENFKYDEEGEILFGDEAEQGESEEYAMVINERAQELADMDHLLITYKGYEC